MKYEKEYKLGLTVSLFTSKENALAMRDNIAKWVKRLKSTRLAQGKNRLAKLQDNNKFCYCCLGIAELCAGTPYEIGKFGKVSFMGHVQSLTGRTGRDLAMDDLGRFNPPIILSDATRGTLAGLNDGADWNFRQIAAFIEGSFKTQTGEDLL